MLLSTDVSKEEDKDTFELKADTGELSLKKELDREEADTHTLFVFITNFPNETRPTPAENSKLKVTVHVIIFVFCCFWRESPQWARATSFTRFLDHTQRRTTVGRNPLDE
jgi:hypothetical protein